ncbi:thioester reductase-like protein [Evansella vedderi]|uniref:Thioester reductase-like protein n=1 Tax=Evansella vedderi TaxID=38282 RepID=A0ABT9ZVB3_9BACI|nr:SDR family oxidoreductase [Evansella vedderi]MDQ0255181.1 thioester reductase-like protein [Evansella vedderi]
MGNVYFFTGFPGFIAKELIKECIHISGKTPIEQIYLLTLPSMEKKALLDLQEMFILYPEAKDLITLVIGDITKNDLNISTRYNNVLKSSVTHVFHLAAVYDLAVDKKTAEKVNVSGTKNVNNWVQEIQSLKRYTYFSTAYVSGKREGRIYEKELSMGQSFKNHYERTKYEAEVLVRDIMDVVPTTIIRPGIVRGHSETGVTTKFDGPYFILHILDRLSALPVIPYLGDGNADGNFVPVDYVIKASFYLTHLETGAGKTYHLTDPAPFKMSEVYRMLAEEYLGKTPRGKLPLLFGKLSMSIPPFRKWMQVEKEALEYNSCLAFYDTRVAENDLQESGIECPSFDKTLTTMVNYYREHKDDKQKYIQIH